MLNTDNVGTKIKAYLDKNFIKNKYLANKLGISETTMSLILSNKRKMSLDAYVVIIDCLGLSFDYFLKE